MQQAISKNALILGAFAIVSSGLIALTFHLTKETIAQKAEEKLQSTLNAIVPQRLYDNEFHKACYLVKSELLGDSEFKKLYVAQLQGEVSAMAVEATAPDGYNGKIHFVLSVLNNDLVGGVRVLEHKETPGLGDKIDERISDWILNFSDEAVSGVNEPIWAVEKDGGKFDQFTGATITPRALVTWSGKAINYLLTEASQELNNAPSCEGDSDS